VQHCVGEGKWLFFYPLKKIAPLVGVIGSIQALEVIKVLLVIGNSLCGKLLLFDAYTGKWRTLKLHPDPACPVCAFPNFLA